MPRMESDAAPDGRDSRRPGDERARTSPERRRDPESAFTSATAAATSPASSTSRRSPAGPARTSRTVSSSPATTSSCARPGPGADRATTSRRGPDRRGGRRPARRTCTRRPSARACKRAGLNPYLCQMTNIREHVSWVHTDKAAATAKAKALVPAACRAGPKQQQPLEPMHGEGQPATLVVGGGIAGIQATLELADAGYHVYLVEREPSIGGHMAQFDKTFPTLDCSACILTPKMSEAGSTRTSRCSPTPSWRGRRLRGQLQGEDPQEGPLRGRRALHRLRHLHGEVPARRSSTTSSRPAWAIARRSTRPSPRPCRGPR